MMGQCHIGGFGVGGASEVNWSTWTGSLDGSATSLTGNINTNNIVLKLDTDKLMVLWRDHSTTPDEVKAVIVTITGTSISVGSIITACAASSSAFTSNIAATVIDSGRVFLTYDEQSGSNNFKGRVLSVSGTTITANTVATIVSGSFSASGLNVVKVDTDKLVVAYIGAAGYGVAVTVPISGNSVGSAGTPFTFNAATLATTALGLAMMDSTHVIVTYGLVSPSTTLKAICLLIGSTTITTPTAEITISTSGTGAGASTILAALSSTAAIVAFDKTSAGSAAVLSLDGTTVSAGTVIDFVGAAMIYQTDGDNIETLNSTQAMITYQLSSNSKGYGVVVTASGTSLSAATPVQVTTNNTNAGMMGIALIDANRALTAFYDGGVPYAKVLKQV